MPVEVTQKQRGPSVLLNYSYVGEVIKNGEYSEESVIDNLVVVAAKIECVDEVIKFYIKSMMVNSEENVSIRMRLSCENPPYNKHWICIKDWSDWEELGVINDCTIVENKQICRLLLTINVKKTEKPTLCANMYLDSDFTDFSLSAVNGSVAVHKVVIASHSEVFKAMLNGDWKETVEGRIEVVGTTREALDHLKDYMYLDILPDEGLCPLLLLASRYMIGNLKTRCIQKLTDTLTSENMYELLDFACLNNITELAYDILHTTPSDIMDKAYQTKNGTKKEISPKLPDEVADKVAEVVPEVVPE